MSAAACPDCGHEISFGPESEEGHIVTCRNCGSEFEIISLNPPELDWAYREPVDDWDAVEPDPSDQIVR